MNEDDNSLMVKTDAGTQANKRAVFSIKGIMCKDHAEKVRGIMKEIEGIEKFEYDEENEHLHIFGLFDVLIVKDSIERVGFLVYDDNDVPCKF